MLELLVATIGLGIAGLDPVGALIAIGALGRGARERHVMAYGVLMIVVTVALGIVLSMVVGTRIASIDWSFLNAEDRFWAVGEAIVGLLLLAWGTRRILRPPATDTGTGSRRGTSLVTLSGLGLLYGLGAILDPTFVALVVLAGRHGSLLDAGIAHLLWILISQMPLVIVLVTIVSGRHRTIIERLQSWWERARPVTSGIITAAVLLAGGLLLVDAGWWFVTGAFLIEF